MTGAQLLPSVGLVPNGLDCKESKGETAMRGIARCFEAAEGARRFKKLRMAAMAVITGGALLLGGCGQAAAPSTSGTAPAGSAAGFAFQATLSGSALFYNQTTVVFNGSGTSSMGDITNAGSAVIYQPPPGTRPSCLGGLLNVNTENFTVTPKPPDHFDGGTFTIVSQDLGCPTGQGKYHGTGHWTVAPGATGRFKGATGEGSLDGNSDFNTKTFTFTATGTIVLP